MNCWRTWEVFGRLNELLEDMGGFWKINWRMFDTCLDSLAALLSLGYKLVGLRVVHLSREKFHYKAMMMMVMIMMMMMMMILLQSGFGFGDADLCQVLV